MIYDLPTTIDISGREYQIRYDYKAILDICIALNDPELSNDEKAIVALSIFYKNIEEIPQDKYEEALKKCFAFIDCNDDKKHAKAPKLVDWEKDFKYIVAPVNRIMGAEIRAIENLHWWSFLSAYLEIGDCTFSQIVRIRDLLHRGKRLDKFDREWYARNREIVDIETVYTNSEKEILNSWGGV